MVSETSFWERYGPIAGLTLAVASIVTTIISVYSPISGRTISLQVVLIFVLAVLYLVGSLFFIRYLRRVRYYDFRIALTGQPGVGKTVFSLLLYEHLMNNRSGIAQFTPDSRSAIATYQAVRSLSADVWPPSTSTGSVSQYDGAITYRSRRTVVNLEIGDSAGQHWMNLIDSSGAEQDYLTWVLSAQAIVHVISAESFLAPHLGRILSDDTRDLLLATRLMRNTKRPTAPPSPLLVVISKMDLVDGMVESECMRVHMLPQLLQTMNFRAIRDNGSSDAAESLELFSSKLSSSFSAINFLFSTYQAVTSRMPFDITEETNTLEWIYDFARKERKL